MDKPYECITSFRYGIEVGNRQELVRCKDCKHYRYYGLSAETVSECTIDHCENPDKEWFCADGEMRILDTDEPDRRVKI